MLDQSGIHHILNLMVCLQSVPGGQNQLVPGGRNQSVLGGQNQFVEGGGQYQAHDEALPTQV